MKIKNEKGISLTALVITVLLLLVICGTMGYYSNSVLKVQKINNMYSDIEQIQTQIDTYYIKNNELPVIGESISFSNSANVNDDSNQYYVIDLSKLGNLRLNYGSDFEKIKSIGNIDTYKDVYIVNKTSQTIYYLKGIEFESKIYYTKPIEYTKID